MADGSQVARGHGEEGPLHPKRPVGARFAARALRLAVRVRRSVCNREAKKDAARAIDQGLSRRAAGGKGLVNDFRMAVGLAWIVECLSEGRVVSLAVSMQ